MTNQHYETLIAEIAKRQTVVKDYILREDNAPSFSYQHLTDAAMSYVKAGGKSLRPAVLMFCCGLVGGDENTALPVAGAIELYHTFTLVHDDIIDQDDLRRGVPTVHADFYQRAKDDMGYDDATARHYGLSLGILAGDVQQGWAASLMTKLYSEFNHPAGLALNLVNELFGRVQGLLLEGETLDIMLSQAPIADVTEEKVLDMLWKKTGVLYEFAGRAGAAIGLGVEDIRDERVEKIATFTGNCGTAFQIQDDILGLVGNEKQLGKPIGSDIKEGKRTIIVLNTLPKMNENEKTTVLAALGNRDATLEQIQAATQLMIDYGGVDYAREMAQSQVQEALMLIEDIPDSEYKDTLKSWAYYMIEREF